MAADVNTRTGATPGSGAAGGGPARGAGAPLSPAFLVALRSAGVIVETTPAYVCLGGVPVAPSEFNKPMTNLLLCFAPEGLQVYVDANLRYTGPDEARRGPFEGPCRQRWRLLAVEPPQPAEAALRGAVSRLLRSPLAAALPGPEGTVAEAARRSPLPLGPLLAATAEPIAATAPRRAWLHALYSREAAGMAAVLRRPAGLPASILAWSRDEANLPDDLLDAVTAAALQLEPPALLVRGAALAAGCRDAADADTVLRDLTRELAALAGTVAVLKDGEHLLAGRVGAALLGDACDRGARLVLPWPAAALPPALAAHAGLRARFVAVDLPVPPARDVAVALHAVAAHHGVAVAPASAHLVRARPRIPGGGARLFAIVDGACRQAAARDERILYPDDLTLAARECGTWPGEEET